MPVADTIPERAGEKAARQLCDNLGLIPTPGTLTVILWSLDAGRLGQARLDAEIAALLDEVPESFVKKFMEHRHWWAAKDLDLLSRKDAVEYQMEADWLKPFIRTLAAIRKGAGL